MRLIGIGCLLLPLIAGAQQTASVEFEAASIKANHSGAPGGSMRSTPGGRLDIVNTTLQTLIRYAYSVKDFQIGGAPSWLELDRFDINATAGGPATTPQLKSMLQTLLEQRFHLKLRHETRELPVFVLSIAKRGTKLKESSDADTTVSSGMGELTMHKATLSMLVNQLGGQLDRPVLDETGLSGKYDIALVWSPQQQPTSDSDAADGVSLSTALQEQLGLKLESRKGHTEVLAIEEVRRTPDGN
jgi:uncharacterized protein (TIGR03435 family)